MSIREFLFTEYFKKEIMNKGEYEIDDWLATLNNQDRIMANAYVLKILEIHLKQEKKK